MSDVNNECAVFNETFLIFKKEKWFYQWSMKESGVTKALFELIMRLNLTWLLYYCSVLQVTNPSCWMEILSTVSNIT